MNENDKNKLESDNSTMHSVIVYCYSCGNIGTQELKIYERVQFIEQDCCEKCNDDIEYIPLIKWYDNEMNAL